MFGEKINEIFIDGKKFYWDFDTNILIPVKIDKTNIINTNNINNINYSNGDEDEIEHEWYMDCHDIGFWETILSRELYYDEKKLIYEIWNENLLNIDIKKLQKNIIDHHCYIKSMTTNIGNCLFESISELGLGDNDLGIKHSQMVRSNLAAMLLAVKNEVGFFPNLPDMTPEQIFLNQNEIEFVKDKNNVYNYDYDMMIYDLNTNCSWSRLPTEFLLMAISRIYQVEILIYHNKNTYVNKINAWDKSNMEIEKIRLGQINEDHYFPLLELKDEYKFNPIIIDEILYTEIKYDKHLRKFKKWSKIIMDSINSNNKCIYEYVDDSKLNYQNYKIMKTNKFLTPEQINDFEVINNLDNFDCV